MRPLQYLFYSLALASSLCYGEGTRPVVERIRTLGELAPLPEAKPQLIELAKVIDSVAFRTAIANSPALQIMRKHLRSTLYHLNFTFEIENDDYPYEPPFKEPFPFRPTLKAMDEAIRFLDIAEKTTGFKAEIKDQLAQSPFFEDLKVLFPLIKDQGIPMAIPKQVIVYRPVETYDIMQDRLRNYGEIASYSEFGPDVEAILQALRSDEVKKLKETDKAFELACNSAIRDLQNVKKLDGGQATRLNGAFGSAFPYRRTIEDIVNGLAVLDMFQRIKYPESSNWHEVEFSWFQGDKQKLLALYHFNRYKYQLDGLLADPEIVLWPASIELTEEDLFRLTAAPWGVLGVITKVQRGDRHFNSSEDYIYHDVNHVRRMWAYLKSELKRRGAVTREQKLAVYKEQEAFIDYIMKQTAPAGDASQDALGRITRTIFYETTHETARPPNKASLLYDLGRTPGTRQPFEIQMQSPVKNLEAVRTFDGNLLSGADKLDLDLSTPTRIRYFWDRAPGFLANIDNKLRWGFYDSVFQPSNDLLPVQFRTPSFLATAAERIFELLGERSPYTRNEMVKMINDRTGQPELWSYYSLKDSGLVTLTGIHAFNTFAGDVLHNGWQLITPHKERWYPANAKLSDGTKVTNQETLEIYLNENRIPFYLREHYRIDKDPRNGSSVMFENLVKLPGKYLADNHRNENMMSASKGISVVDRIWQKQLKFKNLAEIERWLTSACQVIHQAVLDRNVNDTRNKPELNVPWSVLPVANQKNDLEVLRIAFEARAKKEADSRGQVPTEFEPRNAPRELRIGEEQIDMIRQAFMELRQKVEQKLPKRICNAILSGALREREKQPTVNAK